MAKKLTTKEFIKKAQKIHENKYNYNKVDYVTSHIKVLITCPEHGDFPQTPNSHLNRPLMKGYGSSNLLTYR